MDVSAQWTDRARIRGSSIGAVFFECRRAAASLASLEQLSDYCGRVAYLGYNVLRLLRRMRAEPRQRRLRLRPTVPAGVFMPEPFVRFQGFLVRRW